MNVGLSFWRPRRRPSQDHVPPNVRKIWLARESFATAQEAPQQEIVYSQDEVLVLRGQSALHTRAHPSFASSMGAREINLLLWVQFRVPFAKPPVVLVELMDPATGYAVSANHIAEDGFQIEVQFWGSPLENEIPVRWTAAGVQDPSASMGVSASTGVEAK